MPGDLFSEECTDFIVIGSGIAGLRVALGLAAHGSVVILTKDKVEDSSTDAAQGGVAVVLSEEDRVGFHFQDTIQAGDGLCDEEMVRVLVEEGPAFVTELISWGTEFDREGLRLAFTREGAHSKRRILHARGDSTGHEIVRTLSQLAEREAQIKVIPRAFTVDLVLSGDRCVGVSYLRGTERIPRKIHGRAVMMATGGAGHVYRNTTNPPQATGDGVAIAFRSGAEVMDMEFVQFHPTALSIKGAPSFLLSESIRGEGGVLRNSTGLRFMDAYHEQAELAPRDVVSRAILAEIRRSGTDHVFLDLTHLDADFVTGRFPNIHRTCLQYGIDITTDQIPVTPSAHYLMGGIRTDSCGRSSISGLYAAGEVACTGVHGANRLASNSLLEGLVFGARSAVAMLEDGMRRPDSQTISSGGTISAFPAAETASGSPPDRKTAQMLAGLKDRFRGLMWRKVGITRCGSSLEEARDELRKLLETPELKPCCRAGLETLNLLTAGCLITEAALRRAESRGSHYRTDHPLPAERFRRHHAVLTLDDFKEFRLLP